MSERGAGALRMAFLGTGSWDVRRGWLRIDFDCYFSRLASGSMEES